MPNPKHGDIVKIVTSEETVEGTLLPRPEILDPNFIVLKLDNGYNIGIDKKKIKKTTVISPHKPRTEKKEKVKHNPKLPTVALLSFGGTISSKIDYKTGGVIADYDANDFLTMCPELKDIANIEVKCLAKIMSEDMDYNDWAFMAKSIKKELENDNISGVVVTQGTDTLHFSTAAISFALQDLNKPVIFTASQRSIDRGSSDAFMNMSCSIIAAARFDGAVVATCMHGTTNDDYCILNRGTKVRKMHTSRRDAFRPINELPLAKVTTNGKIEVINKNYPKRNDSTPILKDKFEHKIGLLQIHPVIDPGLIEYFIKNKYKGIILNATALGHVPTLHKTNSLIPVIEKAIKAGILVVITTQTLYGRTHPYVYTNLRKLSVELGCVFAEDMLSETAFIKVGWAIGNSKDIKEAKELFSTNIAGEINERITADTFLY